MTKIALIGASGNIGEQTCDVVRRYPDKFCFSALVSARNGARLCALANEFHPRFAACVAGELKEIPVGTKVLKGDDILNEAFTNCDVALIAAGGFAGLEYTLKAARLGKKIALANKESLVCGGELVTAEAKKHGAEIVPVDSEHSALFQALSFKKDASFSKLVLTASGGPFLHKSAEEISRATVKEALSHPTWKMGNKITIDSATLLNKGYEVIEAKWLYGADFSQIETIVHPESIVHSLVKFCDGTAMAQLAYPDMRLPIQLALTYPERLPCLEPLDLEKIATLHFERLPKEKFPCYSYALQAGREGGTRPAVLNGAGETAVNAFLQGGVTFSKIAQTIAYALERVPMQKADSFESLKEADALSRACAQKYLYDN